MTSNGLDFYHRWLVAQLLLSIWNPELMSFITHHNRRRSAMLAYKARGIVMHDRALNGSA